ncbi:hypothetical protein Taro_026522, partial [Colocasia esculenta]|nr:hypothetical protein [Colocasia esculenta]
VRKICQTIAFVSPAFCMTLSSLDFGLPPWEIVAFLTGGLALSSFALSGLYCTHQDISPEYASVLLGITNTVGAVPGIVGVSLTGYLLDSTHSWSLSLFAPSIFFYLTGTIVWLTFARVSNAASEQQEMHGDHEVHVAVAPSRLVVEAADSPSAALETTPMTFAQVVRQSSVSQVKSTFEENLNTNSSGSSSGCRISRPSRKGGVRISLPITREQSPRLVRQNDTIHMIPLIPSTDMQKKALSVAELAKAENIFMPRFSFHSEASEMDSDEDQIERCSRRLGLRPREAISSLLGLRPIKAPYSPFWIRQGARAPAFMSRVFGFSSKLPSTFWQSKLSGVSRDDLRIPLKPVRSRPGLPNRPCSKHVATLPTQAISLRTGVTEQPNSKPINRTAGLSTGQRAQLPNNRSSPPSRLPARYLLPRRIRAALRLIGTITTATTHAPHDQVVR